MKHIPVMLDEVAHYLGGLSTGLIVDGTLGLGGHSEALLAATPDTVTVIGIDRDISAIEHAKKRLSGYGKRFHAVHAAYDELGVILEEFEQRGVHRILLDLGLSSAQLEQNRGFSFLEDAPLDMRFDTSRGYTAAELIQRTKEKELAAKLVKYGDIPRAGRLASLMKERSRAQKMERTTDLVEVCRQLYGPRMRNMDSATLPAQALRILANAELGHLENFLASLDQWLLPEGRIAVISYHSGEDRLVKEAFTRLERQGSFLRLTTKPLMASEGERVVNRRSRSARMRVLSRLEEIK